MASLFGFLARNLAILDPPEAKPAAGSPLRFGILGAADIGPNALLKPAKSHPEAVVYAVAARDQARAAAYAKKHGIEKVYGSYQELLDDPEVDCIYNPLPNGLHYEWTMKALAAGKHVLLEKPAANTVEETRAMFELAEEKNLVLLEAFHYRFHPATQRVKDILGSGEVGAIRAIKANLKIFDRYYKPTDIRYQLSLGGGAVMDMGCYCINIMRFLAGLEPTEVLGVTHQPSPKETGPDSALVDRAADATFDLPGGIIGAISCDMAQPLTLRNILTFRILDFDVKITCEKGEIYLMNYLLPNHYHFITIKTADGKQRTEKAYTFPALGEPWWSTYRYQLEAFVNKVKGRPVHHWVSKEDSIANMQAIESIYTKSGLGIRPKSEWVFAQ
uniref:D-xylose 1-dehydrogenase (NADP(+), D-xylono-1,5-lactone-forming) n=1 Tax=Mycena chlorophos TaxID=658473 RepID=A0ABQ0LHZ4_MYCCL|nr:NAD binding rossmann fold oxidoreductase [Mycena chlorophos]